MVSYGLLSHGELRQARHVWERLVWACSGLAGFAWFGSVGLARLVRVRYDMVRLGLVGRGRHGKVRRVASRCGAVWQGRLGGSRWVEVGCVMAWQVWQGAVSQGKVRYVAVSQGRLKPERSVEKVGRHK